MKAWVDFKQLRASLDFARVLEHYGVVIKRRGHQHYGKCPLPVHGGGKSSDSFSANLERGIFQCFRCNAKGNALEFAALMEGVDPHDGSKLRSVAEKLCRNFTETAGLGLIPSQTTAQRVHGPDTARVVVVNHPLDFELKGLDEHHLYLKKRGLTLETVRSFGLGFCSRGYLKNRIAVPLHDPRGRLVGYAGRAIEDSAITDTNPKYLFPGERTRNNVRFAFRKSLFLYNGFRFQSAVEHLVVVEGFASVWWLTQNGFSSTVATMGSDCSPHQIKLIIETVTKSGRISIMPDADAAGIKYAERLVTSLCPHRFIRWISLDRGQQPTDLSSEELRTRIEQ